MNISHQGIIERVENRTYFVRITAQSACAACHAKGFCTTLDSKEKIMQVPAQPVDSYQEGDAVMVSIRPSAGTKAVVFAYLIPVLLLLLTILIAANYLSEIYSALLALGILAVYYLVLSAFRRKMNSIEITLTKAT